MAVELNVPDVTLNPSLEEVQEAVEKVILSILDATGKINRWADPLSEVGGASFRDELVTDKELAKVIFLMQKLQTILDAMVDTIGEVKVDRLTMLPSGGDGTAAKTVQLVEELKAAIGVDLPKMLTDVTSGRPEPQLPNSGE